MSTTRECIHFFEGRFSLHICFKITNIFIVLSRDLIHFIFVEDPTSITQAFCKSQKYSFMLSRERINFNIYYSGSDVQYTNMFKVANVFISVKSQTYSFVIFV